MIFPVQNLNRTATTLPCQINLKMILFYLNAICLTVFEQVSHDIGIAQAQI